MASINVDINYFDHPKTKRLVGRLGRGAEVLPLKLWAYCGKVHARDGRLTGYSASEIEQLVVWWGKAGEAVQAMVDVGWLIKTEDGYACHEWVEYQGHIYSYSARARTAALAKHAKLRGEPPPAPSLLQAGVKQCPSSSVHALPPKPPRGGGRVGGGGGRRKAAALAALETLKARENPS